MGNPIKVKKTAFSSIDSNHWQHCEQTLEAASIRYENERTLDENNKDLPAKGETARIKAGGYTFSLEFSQNYDDDAGGNPRYGIELFNAKGESVKYYTGDRTTKITREIIDATNRALTDMVLTDTEQKQLALIGSELNKALSDSVLDANEATKLTQLAKQVAPKAKRTAYCG